MTISRDGGSKSSPPCGGAPSPVSLDVLAVGLEPFEAALDDELAAVGAGRRFKAVRGDYGCGKTFFARWLQERAKKRGFATAEVQISETETPLHRLETVYRRLMERLSTARLPQGAFALDHRRLVLRPRGGCPGRGRTAATTDEALRADRDDAPSSGWSRVTRTTPAFAAALRGYRAP